METRRSNCFAAAFRRWWREGGQFAFQPSAHGPFPHVRFRPPLGTWTEFHPTAAKRAHRWPPIRFDGQWRDAPDRAPETRSFGTQAARHRLFWAVWLIVLVSYFAAIVLLVGWSELWKGRACR